MVPSHVAPLSNSEAPQQDSCRHQCRQLPASGPKQWRRTCPIMAFLLCSNFETMSWHPPYWLPLLKLISLIPLLMTSGSSDKKEFHVFGDRSELGFSILVCFLVAFLFKVQSISYCRPASSLIKMPFKKMSSDQHYQYLTADCVARTMNRSSYFWSLVLQAFYFSFPLICCWGSLDLPPCCFPALSWFSCYVLDVTFESGWGCCCFWPWPPQGWGTREGNLKLTTDVVGM